MRLLEKYMLARNNPNKIAWEDFLKGRKDFPEYHIIPNPFLIKGNNEHLFWKEYFETRFNVKPTFPLIVRLINSWLLTGEKYEH